MKKLISILGIPALFAMALGVSVASAQQGGQGGEMPSIDEDTKEKFLDAYADIMEIQTDYAEQIQAADNEEEAMELQQAAQSEMQEAVTGNDLTVEEYNTVIQTASANPDLMAELEAAIAASAE
jgi:hypothetical protein